jgi:hypothetical protein
LLPLLTSPLASCYLAAQQVTAVAYDNPIPGFKTRNCINLRLWAAKPSREFDLEAFNTGDYVQVRFGHGMWYICWHAFNAGCVLLCLNTGDHVQVRL